ncbi:unnamed protein product, partial [Ixodes hexagonus]
MGNAAGSETPVVRDAVTDMSSQEKQAVRDTWAAFKKDARTSSVAIFVVLFLKYPAYQRLFLAFSNEPTAELPRNARAIAHAITVVYAISAIVDTLDEPETAAELVRKVANNHVRHTSVSGVQFGHMGQAVVDVLVEKLGHSMSQPAIESWHRFFAFVVKTSHEVFQ